MTTPRQISMGRSEGFAAPPTAASLPPPPSSSTDLQVQQPSVTIEHLYAMMGRFETCLTDIARAVKPLGAFPRPDPDPPYSRPVSTPLALHTIPASPTWSTSTAVPPPPGFPVPPPTSHGNGYPPPVFIPNPSASTAAPFLGRQFSTNPNPHVSTAWNPPVTGQYGAPLFTQSSWDIPTAQPQQEQPHVQPASCWDHPDSRTHSKNAQQDHRRYIKMDPPHFDGTDASNWISRMEYYFDHLQLPVDQRLHFVVMLFDPPAAEWVFNYRANNTYVQWHEFLEDVRRRFDPLYFQDFTELISKLTQTGTLADYNTKFESMLTRVRDMSESTRLSIYIEGLQQPIKMQVRHQHPTSVAAAMALAVEFAGVTERPPSTAPFARRAWPPREPRVTPTTTGPQPATDPVQPPKPTQLKGSPYARLPVIRLTAAEKVERTKQGLCWYCPKKYGPTHVCNKTFLAYMGVDDDLDDDGVTRPTTRVMQR